MIRARTRWVRLLAAGAALAGLAACSSSPSGSAERSSTTTAAEAGRPAGTVRTEPVDGGTDYFARFSQGLPAGPQFFPIGVWFESVLSPDEASVDKLAGINTYVALTANSDLSAVHAAGLHVIPQADEWSLKGEMVGASSIRGWLLGDEIDMTKGPAEGPGILASVKASLPVDDGRFRYANYGKGVTFWETDEEARRFVNLQDVVSADNYWFTDRNICSQSEGGALLAEGSRALQPEECALAANYGRTVDRVQSLVSPPGSRPVWVFVEVGHPFSENDWPSITPEQVRAAVWSGIIHGARGVVYFNHSFGGPHQTQHALREPAYAAVRSVVTSTNTQIASLAPVLNSPTVLGLVTASGSTDILVKADGEKIYVFAGSATPRRQDVTFTVPCAQSGPVTVLGEDRQIDLELGSFTDEFANGNAVHIYEFDAQAGCGR